MVDVVQVFKEKLKLSHIEAVSQEYRQQILILDLSTNTYKGVPTVNDAIDR